MIAGPRGEQRGSAALELTLGAGLLLLPVTLLALLLPTWIERQSAARVAAGEAARIAVTAQDWADGQARAVAAARQVAVNHDIPPGEVTVTVSGGLARGGAVEVRVGIVMPALPLPGAGGFRWEVRHVEPVDHYRSLP